MKKVLNVKRPILSQMIKEARRHNKDAPLPSPQDIKLRLKNNQKLRISFSRYPTCLVKGNNYPDLTKNPIFSGGYRHYVLPEYDLKGGTGGYVVCGGRGGCVWCRHHDEKTSISRWAVATTVIAWPCDMNGKIDLQALASGVFDVMPWIFGRKVYSELAVLNQEFPINLHDVILHCDGEKYQRITMQPAKDNMFQRLLHISQDDLYWKTKGYKPSEIKDKKSNYAGYVSTIIQDTIGFSKTLPMVLGKEHM